MENKKDEKQTVYVTGYLGKDPEEKKTKSEVKFATVQIGVKKGDKTEWVQITAFGDSTKDLLAQKKGDKITVAGIEKSNPKTVDGVTYENKYVEASKIDEHKLLTVNGNLVKEPELKQGKNSSYYEFSIIQNVEDKAIPYTVKVLDDKGKEAAKDLKKGDFVKIEGDVKFSKFTKDGVEQTFRDIVPSSLTVLKEKDKSNEVKQEVSKEEPKKEAKAKKGKGVSV